MESSSGLYNVEYFDKNGEKQWMMCNNLEDGKYISQQLANLHNLTVRLCSSSVEEFTPITNGANHHEA